MLADHEGPVIVAILGLALAGCGHSIPASAPSNIRHAAGVNAALHADPEAGQWFTPGRDAGGTGIEVERTLMLLLVHVLHAQIDTGSDLVGATDGERELMAAMVAKWNACDFCIGAHDAVAAKILPRPAVDAALADFRAAPISEGLKETLAFLQTMTLRPMQLTVEDARAVLRSGVTRQALTDAIAVAAIFNIVTRYADALDFAMPQPDEFERAADMLLKRGYGS